MKKSSNMGFMLAETLVVASFISITLIYIFVQIRNINDNYNLTMTYNSVNGMYINNEIKKFINQYDTTEIAKQIAYSDLGYYDLTECDSSIFTDVEYCQNFFSRLNVSQSIFTFEKVNVINAEFSDEFKKYLKYISVDNSKMYIIATEFNDGTYASIKLNGYNYATIEDCIKSQSFVNFGTGLYNNTTAENEELIFRGNTNEINNHINVFGYNGQVIEMNNQGVKVIIKKEDNLKFDNNKAYFTKNNFLVSGNYIESSNSNSLLFSSLNSLCENCQDVVIDSTWNVGKITTLIGNSLNNIIANEKNTVYRSNAKNFVGSISVSDIIKASINTSCSLNSITVDCLSENWLSTNIWTMNSNSSSTVWAIKDGAFINDSITNTNSAYAVIYLNKNMKAIGDGTIENPFRVV